jgi:hypothetical protein
MTSAPTPVTSIPSASPSEFTIDAATTALIVIDMQRDFLLPGGVR